MGQIHPAEGIGDDVRLARSGDAAAFERLVAPLRVELHAHCYRMLGSFADADDALQETLIKAWRGLPAFEGRSSVRTWLHTVATHACLDAAQARGRRAMPVDLGPASDHAVIEQAPRTEVAWLGPYPDAGLAGPSAPEARYELREAVEIAFAAALQHLPGNQRAALLLFEVLGYSAAEIAGMMRTSTASVNSALQRARRLLDERVPSPSQQETLRTLGDERVRRLVLDYATAMERADVDAFVALLTEDVTWAMPPLAHWYEGRQAVAGWAYEMPMTRCPGWRHLAVGANGQPALASYMLDPAGGRYMSFGINVLTLRGDRICGITSFIGPEHFLPFGLPAALDGSTGG